MKKIAFPILLAVVTMLSVSCSPEVDLKANIIKNGTYKGVDNENYTWTASFMEGSFAAISEGLSFSAQTWEVTADATDNTKGTITIKGATSKSSAGTRDLEDITGTIEKSGNKIVLTSGQTIITLEK